MKKIGLSLGVISILLLSNSFAGQDIQKTEIKKVKDSSKYIENKMYKTYSIDELKKIIGEDNFIFQDVTLKIKEVADLSDNFILLKTTRLIDMRRYNQQGYKEIPMEFLVSKKDGLIILNPRTGEAPEILNKKMEPISLSLDLKANIDKSAFDLGHGKIDVFLFTDPDCPYCEQFEKNLVHLNKDKYTLHVYLYPLNIHPNSKAKVEYILSQPKNKRFEAYEKVQGSKNSLDKSQKENTEVGKKLLEPMMKYIENYVQIKGTPTILDENGKKFNPGILFK